MAINPCCCWQVYNEAFRSNWIRTNYTTLQILLHVTLHVGGVPLSPRLTSTSHSITHHTPRDKHSYAKTRVRTRAYGTSARCNLARDGHASPSTRKPPAAPGWPILALITHLLLWRKWKSIHSVSLKILGHPEKKKKKLGHSHALSRSACERYGSHIPILSSQVQTTARSKWLHLLYMTSRLFS